MRTSSDCGVRRVGRTLALITAPRPFSTPDPVHYLKNGEETPLSPQYSQNLRQPPRTRPRLLRKGHKFEDKVVTLLRLMGMDVKPRENYGCRETDFVASEQHRFSELWYVGECKDYGHKVGVEEVAQLFARLTAFQHERARNATALLIAQTKKESPIRPARTPAP